MAAGYQVFPGGSPPRERGHVVQRQLTRRQYLRAILAGVAVSQQYVLARKRSSLMWDSTILQQANHGRHTNRQAGSMQEVSVFLLGHGHAFQHQNDGPARGANIDRLIGSVEHQHGCVQGMPVAFAVCPFAICPDRDRPMTPHHGAVHRVVPLPRHIYSRTNTQLRA